MDVPRVREVGAYLEDVIALVGQQFVARPCCSGHVMRPLDGERLAGLEEKRCVHRREGTGDIAVDLQVHCFYTCVRDRHVADEELVSVHPDAKAGPSAVTERYPVPLRGLVQVSTES